MPAETVRRAKGDKYEPTDLFTFRVAAITAKIAAGCMFELPAAFGTRADQARHLRIRRRNRLNNTLSHASFRKRESFQTAISEQKTLADRLLGRGQKSFVKPHGVSARNFI